MGRVGHLGLRVVPVGKVLVRRKFLCLVASLQPQAVELHLQGAQPLLRAVAPRLVVRAQLLEVVLQRVLRAALLVWLLEQRWMWGCRPGRRRLVPRRV